MENDSDCSASVLLPAHCCTGSIHVLVLQKEKQQLWRLLAVSWERGAEQTFPDLLVR